MRKTYQKEGHDTSQPAVPDTVSVALAELAGEMREGLLALAVGTGLHVMAAIMEQDVTTACGPKSRHDAERTTTRHGHGAGSVTSGGRRVPVTQPRMRALDDSGELAVPAYELFFLHRDSGPHGRHTGVYPTLTSGVPTITVRLDPENSLIDTTLTRS